MFNRMLWTAIAVTTAAVPALGQPRKDPIITSTNIKQAPEIVGVFKPVVQKATQSTIRLLVDGKDAVLGTIVAAEGYAVTKASEIRPGSLTAKLPNGKTVGATVIGTSDVYDLAMVKLDASDLTPIQWTASSNAPVGNWIASVGTTAEPVAIGVVSVAARQMFPPYGQPKVATEKSGFLGVTLDLESATATIASIQPGSAAEQAGLKAKDVVLQVEGNDIINSESLINTLIGMEAGAKVKITIDREGKKQTVEATLQKRPASLLPKGKGRGDIQNSMGSTLSERRTGFPWILQHDMVVKPSDCGGPVVDLEGRVVGVNIARAGRVESYAIPAEIVMGLVPELTLTRTFAIPSDQVREARDAVRRAEAARLIADRRVNEAKVRLEKALEEERWWKAHPPEKGPEPRAVK